MGEVNFSVYKISKEVEDSVEIIAKFVSRSDADEYASYEQTNDPTNEFEYIVKESEE
jgi:hypothetical protein